MWLDSGQCNLGKNDTLIRLIPQTSCMFSLVLILSSMWMSVAILLTVWLEAMDSEMATLNSLDVQSVGPKSVQLWLNFTWTAKDNRVKLLRFCGYVCGSPRSPSDSVIQLKVSQNLDSYMLLTIIVYYSEQIKLATLKAHRTGQEKPGTSLHLSSPSWVPWTVLNSPSNDLSHHGWSNSNQGNSPKAWYPSFLLESIT